MSYEAWFITQFREVLGQPLAASDGIDDETINASLGDSPLPSAMRAYYRVAGNHWLNSLHNELRPLDSLESSDGHTIFIDENQLVVRWAVRNADRTTDDPIVY